MLANSPSVVTMMLVTTSIGLTMFFSGVKKRRLRWRTEPRERRRRDWRRPGSGAPRHFPR